MTYFWKWSHYFKLVFLARNLSQSKFLCFPQDIESSLKSPLKSLESVLFLSPLILPHHYNLDLFYAYHFISLVWVLITTCLL